VKQFQGLAQALRLLREEKSYSQEELARRASTVRRVVNSWERERNTPRLPIVDSALTALGADFLDLLQALETVAGRPALRIREAYPDSAGRRRQWVELLELNGLNPADQDLFIAWVRQLGAFYQSVDLAAAAGLREAPQKAETAEAPAVEAGPAGEATAQEPASVKAEPAATEAKPAEAEPAASEEKGKAQG
jgi:transcriptional regulator with XRE-family HTH domain